jgi:hypothetical protein
VSCFLAIPVSAGKPAREQSLPEVPVVATRTNLFEDLIATMDAAVAGRDPVADRALLVEKNDETATYRHNTNHPAFGFHGVTGISVLGNGANCSHNATLVSPRIVVTAGHCWQVPRSTYYYQDGQGVGAEWRFLGRDGKVYYGEALNSRLLTNTVTGGHLDTRMFVLKKPMPPTVEPALWPDPRLLSLVGDLKKIPTFVGTGKKKLWPACVAVTNYADWYEGIRGGDSGSGSFVPFGTNLVLVHTYGGSLLTEGVNWRETAEYLCRKAGVQPSLPQKMDLRAYK